MRGLTKIAAQLEHTRIIALEAEGAAIVDRMIALNERAVELNRRFIAAAVKLIAARHREG
jgi:hypothetical protein